MGNFNMEYYLPIMVMLLIQLIYSGLTLGTRIVLLEGLSPMVFVVYRYAFATIFLAPVAYLSGRNSGSSHSLNLKSFSWIFITSLVGITLDQNLLSWGLYLVSSSVTSAMCNLVPAVTFVIAAFVGMEQVNIRSLRTIAKIIGTIIGVSGAVFIALLKGPKLLNAESITSKSIIGTTLGSDENWLLGCLVLFGSCVAWSVWLILQVPAYASHPNTLSLSAWMCLMATLQSSLVTLFMEADLNAWKITSLLQFGCILYSGVMGSAVALCLQAWCISRRGPLFSAMFTPVSTLIVTVLAVLLLHEEVYIGSLIGAIGVIIGLYIVLWGKAEDVVDVKEKGNQKSIVNATEGIVANEYCEKTYCKTDLEDPLLP
ncbi:putative EamA domain-containing protein [Medicago truncatula]|uniref:WAT1-related protein n=1 Tax=Medicago truncatula TaxID=3880 RepID=G7IQT9_MEDTR|nr:WAT1-related protein At4g30420 [Medicago truncatula]AES66298.1 nodulin MtN21/EamA-like transporter family protein [Medicago truncatula]RHN74441.1 putative EamA domain-containing protein [Medicago truncatula]